MAKKKPLPPFLVEAKVVQSKKDRKTAQLAAIETIRATAGVGMAWNIRLKSGVARIYLGAVRGSKEVAKAAARKSWPQFRGRMTITPNRNFPAEIK